MPGYLILGGTTKAATTALFAHLAKHPSVSAARIKETRFFLDADYPLDTAFPFERGLSAYESLFPELPEPATRLEATPDYLHSPGTAARIRRTLPEARLVFTLRDPIDRLCSWYRFARSTARLQRTMTLEAYVQHQLDHSGGEQPMRSLTQGRYGPSVEAFLDELGRERVHVLFHEELVERPQEVVGEVIRFAGLDPEPLRSLAFTRANPTRTMWSPWLHGRYVRLAFHLRNWSAARPRLFAALRRAHHSARPLYASLNERVDERVELTPSLRARLVEYYAPSVEHLARMLGRTPPWRGYGCGLGSAHGT